MVVENYSFFFFFRVYEQIVVFYVSLLCVRLCGKLVVMWSCGLLKIKGQGYSSPFF